MKVTILACDKCPKHTNAVSTLSLTNGRATKGAPSLDLCGPHVKMMYKLFKAQSVYHLPRKGKLSKAPKKQRAGAHNYAALEAKAIKIIPRLPERFTARDFVRTLKISNAVSYRLADVLIKSGKVKSHGKQRGRYLTAS